MTIPNQLTILRILLIPVMVIVVAIDALQASIGFLDLSISQFIFGCIFVFACLTDFLDGFLARKLNQITTFGKFLDPIADKVLVFCALLYLMPLYPLVSFWSVMVILVREFAVTGVRLLAMEDNVVIAASIWGKYKTASTMIAIILIVFNGLFMPFIIAIIIYYIAIALTIISGIDYLYKNRKIILKSV